MIPHDIHFIWVGPSPVPQDALDNIAGWKRLNPSWRVILWSDTVKGEGPWDEIRWTPVINQRLYDNMARYVGDRAVWAGRSDILRLEIIAQFGGLYLDIDVLPLKPLGPLLDNVRLCMADERDDRDLLDNPNACNGNYLIGAEPNHPALWTAVREIERNMAVKYKGNIIRGTGPMYVFSQLTRHPDCVVFPFPLFNPCRPYTDWRQVKEWPATAYANHCFVGTWYDRDKRPPTSDL